MVRQYIRRSSWTDEDYRAEMLSRSSVSEDQRWIEFELEKPCRFWTSPFTQKGYGRYSVRGENMAHRVSHSLFNRNGDDVDADLLVCHRCDNPPCIERGPMKTTSPIP